MHTYRMSLSLFCFDEARFDDTSVMKEIRPNVLLLRQSKYFQVTPELVYFVFHIGKKPGALQRLEK